MFGEDNVYLFDIINFYFSCEEGGGEDNIRPY